MFERRDTTNGFRAGTPRRLFATPPFANVGWDVAPDGKPFLFLTPPNGGRPAPFTVVLNWAAALKKKTPVERVRLSAQRLYSMGEDVHIALAFLLRMR
jgi:hypothetical protein